MDNSLEKKELKRIIETLELIYIGEITIEEGEKRCFSPKNAIRLEKEQCNQRIVDLIWECCELENIESLIPHKLKKMLGI